MVRVHQRAGGDSRMTRDQLNETLIKILGSKAVYYQPPASLRMQYPCIRYAPANIDRKAADNQGYLLTDHYTLTYISKSPDRSVPMKLLRLPRCTQNQVYTSDGLYHEVFSIYI